MDERATPPPFEVIRVRLAEKTKEIEQLQQEIKAKRKQKAKLDEQLYGTGLSPAEREQLLGEDKTLEQEISAKNIQLERLLGEEFDLENQLPEIE